jgi:regulator of replication initiation timing
MDKLLEALSNLLPEDQIKDISGAVSEYLEEAKKELEADFSEKLEEAYVELHGKLQENEETALEGYQQAYAVIQDLRNRLEVQRNEYETAIEEGYEEAYQMLLAERGKNESLELDVYEAAEEKLSNMKEYMVDKVDQFLQYKGQEIYEQARRDIINDPRMAEHKVTLDRVVETVQNYISDEDYALASNNKIEAANKQLDELKGKVKILEARNIRMGIENKKLNEQVREATDLINESTVNEKKNREESAKNVQGRGHAHVSEGEQIIAEFNNPEASKPSDNEDTIVEGFDPAQLKAMQVLAGTAKNEE